MNTKIRLKYKEDQYGRLTRTRNEIKFKKTAREKKEGVRIRMKFKQKKCR